MLHHRRSGNECAYKLSHENPTLLHWRTNKARNRYNQGTNQTSGDGWTKQRQQKTKILHHFLTFIFLLAFHFLKKIEERLPHFLPCPKICAWLSVHASRQTKKIQEQTLTWTLDMLCSWKYWFSWRPMVESKAIHLNQLRYGGEVSFESSPDELALCTQKFFLACSSQLQKLTENLLGGLGKLPKPSPPVHQHLIHCHFKASGNIERVTLLSDFWAFAFRTRLCNHDFYLVETDWPA